MGCFMGGEGTVKIDWARYNDILRKLGFDGSFRELISILLDDLMVVARDNLSIEYLENGGDEEEALKSFNVEMRKNLEKRIIA